MILKHFYVSELDSLKRKIKAQNFRYCFLPTETVPATSQKPNIKCISRQQMSQLIFEEIDQDFDANFREEFFDLFRLRYFDTPVRPSAYMTETFSSNVNTLLPQKRKVEGNNNEDNDEPPLKKKKCKKKTHTLIISIYFFFCL